MRAPFPTRRAAPALVAALAVLALTPSVAAATSYAGAPVTVGGLHTVAEASNGAVKLGIGGRFAPRFWPGMNLGVTVPGTQPGELAATRADYDRWLRGIGRIGARLVRVYTIQRPVFYDALAAYNRRHRRAPLYLIQGVWIPEDAYDSERDVFTPDVTNGFRTEIDNAVNVLHGDAVLPTGPGHASGHYHTDVSRWTLSMLLGIEWDPEITLHIDQIHAGTAPYHGRYFTATPDATPMESWLAAMLDEAATRQAARGWSMPMAFVNWVTTDPLHHPSEPLTDEDLVSIDATHVLATPAWPGGTYASYHVYPYYPDSLRLDPALASAADPYQAYLQELRAHHGSQPVMVTEFGVPTGIGIAHRGPLGRDQGGHSERQAGAMDAAMMADIKRAGLTGGVLFEWIDEWFKRTWNTQDFALPADRRALWLDDLTNEAQFGVIRAVPQPGPVRTLQRARRGPVRGIRASTDAEALTISVKTASPSLTVGFDVRPEGNRGLPGHPGVDPQADAALVVDGRGAQVFEAAWWDPVGVLDGAYAGEVPFDPASVVPGSGAWQAARMLLSHPLTRPDTGQQTPAQTADVSHLPAVRRRGTVSVRIPWALLGLGDPSSRQAFVPHADGTVTLESVPHIGVAVLTGSTLTAARRPVRWAKWNRVFWHERRKAGWSTIAAAFAAAGR